MNRMHKQRVGMSSVNGHSNEYLLEVAEQYVSYDESGKPCIKDIWDREEAMSWNVNYSLVTKIIELLINTKQKLKDINKEKK